MTKTAGFLCLLLILSAGAAYAQAGAWLPACTEDTCASQLRVDCMGAQTGSHFFPTRAGQGCSSADNPNYTELSTGGASCSCTCELQFGAVNLTTFCSTAIESPTDPVCGDQFCNGNENHDSCPGDCREWIPE